MRMPKLMAASGIREVGSFSDMGGWTHSSHALRSRAAGSADASMLGDVQLVDHAGGGDQTRWLHPAWGLRLYPLPRRLPDHRWARWGR